ncbi:putative C-_U-editing enzyme APOBEC-4 [Rhinophrynus dorsalis]
MATLFQEYSGYQGTLVIPYYWFYPNQNCSKCPYHIRTGEEARVTYGQFYEAFGFPYGPTMPEDKQLIFYEIKTFSGAPIQKGHVTNCRSSNLHAESILFENQGYLDYLLYQYNSVGYITLYANYTPCNEYAHGCISKIYDFLLKYPETRLDIYFSQLYHVEENFPTAVWNSEALRSLAGLWPRVTLNPISNGLWQTILYNFVKGISSTTLYQPILPARSSADSYNAYRIHVITGIKPYFVDVPPAYQQQETKSHHEIEGSHKDYSLVPQPHNGSQLYSPFIEPHIPFVPFPAPAFHIHREATSKPMNIVRHLKMPGDNNEEVDLGAFLPLTRKINEVVITEKVIKEKDMEEKNKSRKKKKKNLENQRIMY